MSYSVPGVRFNIEFYITSPSTGLNSVVSVNGKKDSGDQESVEFAMKNAISVFNTMMHCSDGRPMTDAEIADYVSDMEADRISDRMTSFDEDEI